jgi:hypothetical protein
MARAKASTAQPSLDQEPQAPESTSPAATQAANPPAAEQPATEPEGVKPEAQPATAPRPANSTSDERTLVEGAYDRLVADPANAPDVVRELHLHELNQLLRLVDSEEGREAFNALKEGDKGFKPHANALASIAGAIARQLDQRYHNKRWETVGPEQGVGVYAEAGPLGHIGIGAGVVTRSTKDGITSTQRSGAGFYLRLDHQQRAKATTFRRSI